MDKDDEDDLDEFGLLQKEIVVASSVEPNVQGIGLSPPNINTNIWDSSLIMGQGIKWATAQPALSISMSVNYLSTATWTGTVFGKTASAEKISKDLLDKGVVRSVETISADFYNDDTDPDL